ncbi:MAG: hypothetical protein ACREE4_00430 [Stellaceae bacterium]
MLSERDTEEIFRREALDRRAQQERLDAAVTLSAARRWITGAAVMLFVVAALLCLALLRR